MNLTGTIYDLMRPINWGTVCRALSSHHGFFYAEESISYTDNCHLSVSVTCASIHLLASPYIFFLLLDLLQPSSFF